MPLRTTDYFSQKTYFAGLRFEEAEYLKALDLQVWRPIGDLGVGETNPRAMEGWTISGVEKKLEPDRFQVVIFGGEVEKVRQIPRGRGAPRFQLHLVMPSGNKTIINYSKSIHLHALK